MNPTVVASVITGVLAVGAGVAIAGLPSDPPAAELVITDVPTTTTTTVPIVPDTVAPLATTSTTTPGTSTSDATTVPDTSGTTVDGGAGESTTTVEQPPVSRPLAERSELFVATANAAGVGGVASATRDALTVLGYTDVQPVDAVDPVSTSVVYYGPDLAPEAVRLAADLGWDIGSVAPIDELPELTGSGSFDLVALIGADQVGPVDEL